MIETARWLAGDFILCDLGSANALDLPGLRPLRAAITLVELDAIGAGQTSNSGYLRKVALQKAISGQPGPRVFHRRQFPPSSSFLKFKPELTAAYGLQSLYAPAGDLELECETLASLLSGQGLAHIDFLKTDLEGLDFEVMASAPEITGRSLVIQSELRFQPLYAGEPDFFAVGTYLRGLEFEMITLRPEVWKYATPRRDQQRDGRLVWADAVFFLRPAAVERLFGEAAPRALLKQVVLAQSLGLSNYAEFLFEGVRARLPALVAAEMAGYLRQSSWARRLVNAMAAWPAGNRAMLAARHACLKAARALSYVKALPHIGFPF
jgi:hypothetical protein